MYSVKLSKAMAASVFGGSVKRRGFCT